MFKHNNPSVTSAHHQLTALSYLPHNAHPAFASHYEQKQGLFNSYFQNKRSIATIIDYIQRGFPPEVIQNLLTE